MFSQFRQAGALLGPQEYASAPGFLKSLAEQPLQLCFVDELGDEFQHINNQNGNTVVQKIFGELKKCYNSFEVVRTARKVDDESATIDWPAPFIVGASTPQMFFEAFRGRDFESGFANRLFILPFEGLRKPPERDVPLSARRPPRSLCDELERLPGSWRLLDQQSPPGGRPKLQEVGWDAGAKDMYYAFSARLDALEGTKNYELSLRVCENAVRLATIVAVGRRSKVVERPDMAWALALSEHSWRAAVGGREKYVHEYLEFPRFCAEVLKRLEEAGGWMSMRDLERDFRSNKRYGAALGKDVLPQLVVEERVRAEDRASRGRTSPGWRLIKEWPEKRSAGGTGSL
jgi:hypothetical protein